MIPVYITHDGQAYTAKYSPKKGIYGEREFQYNSFVESLRTYSQPVVGAIYSTLSLNDEPGSHIYDEELAAWCAESFGISFSSVVSDIDAVHSLIKSSTETTSYQIIYRLEGRIKFILVENNLITSVIHMAQEELESAGLGKLIERSRAWYSKNGNETKIEEIYTAGEFPKHSETVVPLWESTNIHSLIAAGIPLAESSRPLQSGTKLNSFIRNLRTTQITFSILVLVLALTFFMRDKRTLQTIQGNIESSPYQIELSENQINTRDSLATLSVEHIKTFRHLSNQRRWSNILEKFSEVPHEGLTLSRFGSRESNGVLNLAFDGEGKSEKAVTGYVQKLKESDTFGGVQLMQIDRKSNGKFRFRIQCNVQ